MKTEYRLPTMMVTVEVWGEVYNLAEWIYRACAWCVPKSHVSGINHLIQLALSELGQKGPAEFLISFSGTTRANFERARQHLQVAFDDIDGDRTPEIVVIMRSVGSGGYVSADAFRYKSGSFDFVTSVSDLDKGADPIRALRRKYELPDGRKD